MEVVLRNATLEDVPRLVFLDQEIFGGYGAEEDPKTIRGRVEVFPEGCFVLETEEQEETEDDNQPKRKQIYGYLTTEKWKDRKTPSLDEDPHLSHHPQGKILNITTLAISTKFQSKGLGSRLLERAKVLAKEENCTEIILETAKAKKFYERNGFELLGEKEERGIPLFIMSLSLSPSPSLSPSSSPSSPSSSSPSPSPPSSPSPSPSSPPSPSPSPSSSSSPSPSPSSPSSPSPSPSPSSPPSSPPSSHPAPCQTYQEIVSLSLGNCGNVLQHDFYSSLFFEHQIDPYTRELLRCGEGGGEGGVWDKMGVYFEEGSKGKYRPRAFLLDVGGNNIHQDFSELFDRESILTTNDYDTSLHGNWARGHYTTGAEMMYDAEDEVRRLVENCDRFQGFQITHSMGGGMGGGTGTLMMTKMRERYPDRMMMTFSVMPAPVSTFVGYNVILGMHHLIENSDANFCFDNDALSSILSPSPPPSDLYHLNPLITESMLHITTPFRLPSSPFPASTPVKQIHGQNGNNFHTYKRNNENIREMVQNLVPFPRMHFFSVGLGPLSSSPSSPPCTFQHQQDLANEVFSPKNNLTARHKQGKAVTSTLIIRQYPNISAPTPNSSSSSSSNNNNNNKNDDEVEKNTQNITPLTKLKQHQDTYPDNFVDWVPSSSSVSFSSLPNPPPPGSPFPPYSLSSCLDSPSSPDSSPSCSPSSAVVISNNTAIRHLFDKHLESFATMFRRKAYLWGIRSEGIDEMEFTESEANTRDLVTEYECGEFGEQGAFLEDEDYE